MTIADHAAAGMPFVAAVLDHDVTPIDLHTGRWPTRSKPVELADLLANAARDD